MADPVLLLRDKGKRGEVVGCEFAVGEAEEVILNSNNVLDLLWAL